jgi:hypothetical protein
MTNREWIDLIAKEFNVSNTVAKGMLHSMYEAKRILSVNRDVRRKMKEQKEAEEKQFREWERMDEDDYNFMNNYERNL